MSDLLTRRKFLITCAAASFLAGCERVHPVSGFLQGMKDWNEKFEELLFSRSASHQSYLNRRQLARARSQPISSPTQSQSYRLTGLLRSAAWLLALTCSPWRKYNNCRERKCACGTIASKDGRRLRHGMESD